MSQVGLLNSQKRRQNATNFKQNKSNEYNQPIEEANEKNEEDVNEYFKFGITVADLITEMGGGFLKGVEGIVDAGVGLIGGVSGALGADTKWAEDFIKYDATNELYYEGFENNLTKYSSLNEGTFVKDLARGIGQQLPTIALAPFGLSGIGVAGTVIGAGGSGAEEALNEGANFNQALGYGALQMGIEGLIESVTGLAGKGVTSIGKAINNKAGKETVKTVAKTIGKTMKEEAISEAIEEGASALLNPLTKTVYKGKEALNEYSNIDFYKDAGKQAVLGGIIGGITAGASGVSKQVQVGGKENYSTLQSNQQLANIEKQATDLMKNNNFTTQEYSKLKQQKQVELENISKNLKSLSPEKRKVSIEKFKLTKYFNENGDIIDNSIKTENQNKMFVSDSDNINAYTPNLSNEEIVVKPTNQELTETSKVAKRNLLTLNPNAKLVITDDLGDSNGFYDVDSKIFYLSNSISEEKIWGHEFTHSLEGTEEYNTMANYLLKNDADIENKIAKKSEQYKKIHQNILSRKNGKELLNHIALTEIVADKMGEILSNQGAVDRIVNKNKKGAIKILQWIADNIKKLSKSGTKLEDYKFLLKAQDLFINAVNKSIGGFKLTDVDTVISKMKEDEEKQNSNNSKENTEEENNIKEIRYSLMNKKSFTENVKDIINMSDEEAEKYDMKETYISVLENTPEIILNKVQNAENNEIIIRADTLYLAVRENGIYNKSYHYHNLGNTINDLPNMLKNPDLILKTSDKKINLITSIKNNGNQSLISIELNTVKDINSKYKKYNLILTMFPFDFNYLSNLVNKNDIKILYKNEDLLQVNPQLHTWMGIINNKSSINNISKTEQKVNTNQENLSKDNKNTRFALKDTVEQDVLNEFGKTYDWRECGYILKGGEKLDLSGRNRGSRGGARTVDHREIFDIYEDGDTYGTDALIEFMGRGNIRVLPEYPGINLQVEPTKEQYEQIQSLVERLGWRGKYFTIDIDNTNGDTIETLEYNGAVSGRKVIEDLKYYFKEGKLPYKSELSEFRYSKKITADMTEDERYEILKDKELNLSATVDYSKIEEYENKTDKEIQLNGISHYSRVKLLKKIGEEFGIFKSYINKNVNLRFEYSRGNLDESLDNQKRNYENFLKMLTCFDGVIDNAIGIEVHNRNKEGYKEDLTLKDIYVLISAFNDKDKIIPVKLEIKEFYDKNNSLYVAIALESIKKDADLWQGSAEDFSLAEQYLSTSKISLPKLFEKINSSDKKILKYIPNQFLNEEQIKAKQNALEKDKQKYSNKRHSLKDGTNVYNYSEGEIKKYIANNSRTKVYSKTEAETVINNIIESINTFDDVKKVKIAGKTKEQAINALWNALNTADEGYRTKVALEIADYLIDNTAYELMIDEGEVDNAMLIIEELGHYMHKFDLESIKGEIRHRYDKDNTPFLMWGKKRDMFGKGFAVDDLQVEYENGPLTIFDGLDNQADIFFALHDNYRKAVETLKKEVKPLTELFGSEKEREQFRQEIARDILLSFDTKGKETNFAKTINKYTNKIKDLQSQIKDLKMRNRLLGSIEDLAQKFKDDKFKTFANATEYKQDIFKSSIDKLGQIKFKGNFNLSGTRKILGDLAKWYNKDNPLLDTDSGYYVEGVEDTLKELASSSGEFSIIELRELKNVLTYFKKFVENYNKVFHNGKYVDALPLAQNYIDKIHKVEKVKKKATRFGTWFSETFFDPMAVVRKEDCYSNGFLTEMTEETRNAVVDSEIAQMEIRTDLDNFLDKNKNYIKNINNETVKVNDIEIPKVLAISLFMTQKRKQAWKGLVKNGFSYKDKNNKFVRTNGSKVDVKDDSEIIFTIMKDNQALQKQFNEKDLKFIKIIEKIFNKDLKQLKADRDIQRLGFTNTNKDYYFPIKRFLTANNIDSELKQEIDRISNASFNKDTVKGAQQELYIEPIDIVLERHIKGVCNYAYISPIIEKYNRLYNLDISGNKNKPINLASEYMNFWQNGNTYFQKLLGDIQGINKKNEMTSVLRFIRGGYAKYQLGANPKVWITQLSSLFASSSILDYDCITKGMSIKTNDVDKYCLLAKLRNQDNTATMAQSVMDNNTKLGKMANNTVEKVDKISNALMTPIGKMDRFVIERLFGACQVQTQKNKGLELGTEENKIEAGKLLKRVILETQQNSMPTERSVAMRSESEMLKTVTMFTADAMKTIGRVIDSYGEYSVVKELIKQETNDIEKAKLEERLKRVKKKVAKSNTALITSALFMATVAELFHHIYNKDRKEDENAVEEFFKDFVGNLFGGLPLIKDVYSFFVHGYDIKDYNYSVVNDLLSSVNSLVNLSQNLNSNSQQEVNRGVRDLINSVGQVTGVPTRNLYNVFYGLTKRFNPSLAYQINSNFYNNSYVKDLEKALEKGDTKLASTITGIILNERLDTNFSKTSINKLNELYKKDYSVLPRNVNNSITYNNIEYNLTNSQMKDFKDIYNDSYDIIENTLNSSNFTKIEDKAQAKAIKFIFDYHYNLALSDVVDETVDYKKQTFAKAVPIQSLAVAVSQASLYESDKNKNGIVINGSKKIKIQKFVQSLKLSVAQKYLIMGYLGYTNKFGEGQVRAYLNSKNLTKSEKEYLLEQCGY